MLIRGNKMIKGIGTGRFITCAAVEINSRVLNFQCKTSDIFAIRFERVFNLSL